MTDLGKGIESEIASVPDNVSKEVVNLQKGKKKQKQSASDIIANVPPPDPSFHPIHIPERQTRSLVTNKRSPIEYFSIFFTPDWLERFAEYTNKNAAKKRSVCGEDNRETASSLSDHQRPWNHPTNGPEIGVFIGSLLMMGLEYRGQVPFHWSTFSDIQGNREIMTV